MFAKAASAAGLSGVGSQPIRIPASKQRSTQQHYPANTTPPQQHTPPQYTGEEDEEDEERAETAEDEHEHTAFSVSLPQPSSPSQSLPLSSIPTIPAPSPSSSSPSSPHLSPSPSPPTTASAAPTASYDAHPERIGETIANFTLLSVIGRGGYGKVYLAQHTTTHRLYALKVMKKSVLATKNITSAAIQEKHILSLLSHPSLVTLRYAFQSPSKLYLVMDYVAGGELFARLDGCSGGRMVEREVMFYAAEIVIALEWLHERNIIYRDLKPENLLLDRRGHIVLSDFGFAKSCIESPTQTNSFLGTTHAMSPEMIRGSGHGKGTDWWALGVLITELLTGRPPWQASNKAKLQELIVSGPLHLPKYLSIPAKSIIQGLLRRTIDKRLGCGEDGAAAIKSHAFFASINWVKVAERKMKAPWVPPLTSERDVSMFDTQFTSEGICDSPSSIRRRTTTNTTTDGEEEEKERVRGFEGFSYTRSPYMGAMHSNGGLLDRSQEIGVTVGSVSNFVLASPSTTPSQHSSPVVGAADKDSATNKKLIAQRAREKAREMEEEREEKEKEKEREKEREQRKKREETKKAKREEQIRKEREEEDRLRRVEEEEFQRKQHEEQQRIKQQQAEDEQRKRAAVTPPPPHTTPSRPISQLSAQLAQRQAALPSPITSASGAKLAPWAHKAGIATTPPPASSSSSSASAATTTPRPITSSISSPAISALRQQPQPQPQPPQQQQQAGRDFVPHIPITARLFPTLEASTQQTRSPSASISNTTTITLSAATPKAAPASSVAAPTPKAKTTWARLF